MWGRGKGCWRNDRSYHSLRIYVRCHPRNANVLSSMIPSTRNLKNMILSTNKPSGLGMTVTPKTQFPDKQRTLQITQWSQRCFLETGFHHLRPDDLTGKWNCTKCSLVCSVFTPTSLSAAILTCNRSGLKCSPAFLACFFLTNIFKSMFPRQILKYAFSFMQAPAQINVCK